ncbi:Peptidyl-tRNA hydrolase ICT1, mitochondrial [Hondaea fermentalgiana]|uniref:Peptidyl-tRNA hydrolase ICT1, mitochondrial n=1 Tax=Hondaea fermentalgiana TaxID=2315210 RepID=A0A2R5H0Y2_9STRA|nr:Peptidyl-tRNA hydrolase ICT1, mitochondrial [Hondaea fermentalgiana]|eukprot:GBG34431.1 Peptidyl-tRNA hydrolase ICT1, mitochondrial [Hondaea fermentalgiana]
MLAAAMKGRGAMARWSRAAPRLLSSSAQATGGATQDGGDGGASADRADDAPLTVDVPKNAIRFKAVRSSGPGGQAVNKQSTCVEARVNLYEAFWLPDDARERLMNDEANRINKVGDLIVVVQEQRTQELNKRIAQERVQQLLDASLVAPKERVMRVGISEAGKEYRKESKRYRSKIKQARRVSKKDW